MNKNAGQAELLRFTCKVIFSAQMVINLALPAYRGVHESPAMRAIIATLGRELVLSSSITTAVFLMLGFWARELRVMGGLAHAILCLVISMVAMRSGYYDSAAIWAVYAFGGSMLAATGVRRER